VSVIISVVVPSRGGAGRLPSLLDRLAAQTQSGWEAIVVLDGDIDNSAGVVELRRSTLPVRVVTFPENRGRPAALNAGFEVATGEILVRCDDDLAPKPDFLSRHVEAHRDGPVGVIGMCRNIFPHTPYATAYGWPAYLRQRAAAYAAPPEERWHYWGGNISIDRGSWDRVGPYDPDFRAYGWEDVDWGYRLMRAGVPIVVEPGLETDHHIAATTTAGRALRAYYSGSARRRFETKHGFQVVAAGGRDPWNLAVRTAARLLSEQGIDQAGRVVDRLADRVPRRVAEKAVALTVEAGALAGYRRSDAGHAI
jgi:glycosyltransferase involved in cell wall biosynthesis